ncbi:MAG: hypothetical protein AB1813_17285 [Verrucomicrobiota bacterium]
MISTHIKGGGKPTCPGGGDYTYDAVGAAPTCSKRYADGFDHTL